MEALLPILSAITISLPVIIVWVIGIAMALSRWRRHPRVSLFALIGCAVMIVNSIVSRVVTISLPVTMAHRGWTYSQLGPIFTAIGVVSALISAGAWALVICAIFGWRDQRQKGNLFPPAPPDYGNEPREQNATFGFPQR
ncbi:MAG TPA: hypothetical protein VFV58_32085 [Blastocatellia bacterium]|nr:hypothetical protein [Blastocatellia bacterium]